MKYFISSLIYLILLFGYSGCKDNKETSTLSDQPAFELSIKDFLDSSYKRSISIVNKEQVNRFYEANNFLPVWSVQDSLLPAGDSLIQFIYSSPFLGLFPDDYHAGEIKSAEASGYANRFLSLDILLTDSFISLWNHLKFGRSNPYNSKGDSLSDVSLQKAVMQNSVVRSLQRQEPQNSEYIYLKSYLAKVLREKERNNLVTIDDTVQTLFNNLERWRWENPFPDRYILVNIPSYKMTVVEKKEKTLESKVIVGKPETPTHRITSLIERFTIYPYWHIPRKIAVGEMLPLIQKDTNYIRRNNLDVLDRKGNLLRPAELKWKTFHEDYFPILLRQREGADNSLGVIKFQFKNPYAIYLHDTNAKRLFKEDHRALSHGCVRVEKAHDLAYYLVKEDSILCTPDDLKQYLEIQHRMEIEIVNPIPLYIRYFTAEATADTLFIYEDIYKMDDEIN